MPQTPPERRRDYTEAAIKVAVHETLTAIGFDMRDPNAMQDDIRFLRRWRQGADATKTAVWRAIITVTIPACLYLLWYAFKLALTGRGIP